MKYPITPEYILALPDKLAGLYIDLEAYILNDICSRFNISGTATETAIELIRQLKLKGYDQKKIEAYIKKTLKLTTQEFNDMWADAVDRNQMYFDTILDKKTLLEADFDPYLLNQQIEAIKLQTLGELQNITQSMGFAINVNGQPVFTPIAEAYQKVLDDAAMRVQSGATSYNQAIREATKQLTDSGLQTVDYASGWHNRTDVAARRAVMTGITQLSSKYTEQEAKLLDTELFEVSAHKGARDIDKPHVWSNHKKWQGKVYSKASGGKYPSIYEVCGLGEVDGLCGANCRHMYYAYVEGISERTYTDEELKNIDGPPITYQGRKYNAYQSTQKQRQIEANIRKCKRELIAAKASGDDEYYNVKASRLIRLKKEYKDFSEAAGLPMQSERANIAEFGPTESKMASLAAKINNK